MTRNSRSIYLFGGLVCVAILTRYVLAAVGSGDQVTINGGGKGGIKKAPTGKSSLVTLSEADWDQILVGEWMVEFHAPWCPACRALQPEWKTFSGWASDLGIKVGAVDVTAYPGLSGRFLVTALPTIYHVKDGIFRQYKGTRDTNAFVSFIEEKKWQSIEAVTTWKAPDSYQMSFVSQLFKISMALRSVHNSLVEDYGIPYWGSYIVFALATILVGAILGLLIVCVIDLIWPAKLGEVPYKELARQLSAGAAASGGGAGGKQKTDDIIEDDVSESGSDEGEGTGTPGTGASEETATTDDDQAAGASAETIEAKQTSGDDGKGQQALRKRRARKDGN